MAVCLIDMMMLARNNLEMGDVIFNWVSQSVPPTAMTGKTEKYWSGCVRNFLAQPSIKRSDEMKKLPLQLMLATLTLSVFAACTSTTDSTKNAGTATAAKADDKQWTMPNKDYASTRYSTL